MSIDRLTQGIMTNDSALTGFTLWPKEEVFRIEALLDQEVLSELEGILDGRNYSWHSINELMKAQLYKGALEFTFRDGDVIFEWNNLCDEKRHWEQKRRLSFSSREFNRDCLINLKILPAKAGFGLEGSRLVVTNLDDPNLLTKDLWVASEEWEAKAFKCFQVKSHKKSVGEEDDDDEDDDDENDDDEDEEDEEEEEDEEDENENEDEDEDDDEYEEESDSDDFDESEYFESLYEML